MAHLVPNNEKKMMQVKVYECVSDSEKNLIAQSEFDALAITVLAETREDHAIEIGRECVVDTQTYFANELAKALKSGRSDVDIEAELASLAMVAWHLHSTYGTGTAEQFDLIFTILSDKGVKCDYVQAGMDTN
jgi:hypothetical protein